MISFSPEYLQTFIREHELPKRVAAFGPEAEVVLRYGAFTGADLRFFNTLPRAMNHARELIEEANRANTSFANGTTIVAGSMTGSKGRFTRTWHAPEGGLWGCLAHVNALLDKARMFIPMAVGVACCETVHEFGAPEATVRWVNDVMLGEQKIAGFLVESFTEPRFGEKVDLIGFGVNLNNQTFPTELQHIATSLSQIVGKPVDLSGFTMSFLAKLSWYFGLLYFEEEKMLRDDMYSNGSNEHPVLRQWKLLSDTLGKRVTYGFDVMENPQYTATVTDINDSGGLIMALDDGSTIVEYSGEVRYLNS